MTPAIEGGGICAEMELDRAEQLKRGRSSSLVESSREDKRRKVKDERSERNEYREVRSRGSLRDRTSRDRYMERSHDTESDRRQIAARRESRVVYRPRPRELERERERARVVERAVDTLPAENVVVKTVVPEKEKGGEECARKYQLEVLGQAQKKNTIAFLETGAGKTLIAVLLMKSKYEMMRKRREKMLAVFLVPKVPLVYQVRTWTLKEPQLI